MALPKFISFFQSLDSKQIYSLRKYVLTHVGAETEAFGVLEYLSVDEGWRKKYPGNEVIAGRCLAGGGLKTFLNYLSQLYDISQEWMALDQLKKEPYEQEILVQRWLNRKGLHQQAELVRAKVLRNLDNEVGEDYNLARYRSEVHFEYLFCNNPDMNDYREEDYRDMIHGFDAYFSGKASMMMCEVASFGKYFRVDMSKDLLHMEKKVGGLKKDPMVELTKLAYKLISKPDTKTWLKLSEAILNGECKNGGLMHSVLTRYCVKAGINLWSQDKHKEVGRIAAIAQYGLRTGVYSEGGKLSPSSFHNLVTTLCQVLTEKEMLTFVKKWSKEVDQRYQEAAMKIGNAQVYFYKQKYHLIKSNTNVKELSPNQRYLAQGLDLIAAFEGRKIDEKLYKRQVLNFTNYLRYNKDKISAESLAKYRNLYRLMRDIDQKPGKLKMEDYNPVFYRKYCMRCLENKNGNPQNPSA